MAIAVQILLALAPYLVPVLVAVLTYAVKALIDKLPSNQRPVVASIVQSSVSAAEQMASDQLNGPGKKQLALELVQAQLKHYKLDVPDAVVNTLIEDSVLALNTAKSGSATAVVPLPMDKSK